VVSRCTDGSQSLAEFHEKTFPNLASDVAKAIIAKSALLTEYPNLGRPIPGRPEYRQIALEVLNAVYVFQYRIDGERVIMLRVFHAREGHD
jgi:plasmid stabilization system protein ParE